MVKKNAVYLVTEAVILSKQLKGKYELLFFSRHINHFHQPVRRSHNPKALETH